MEAYEMAVESRIKRSVNFGIEIIADLESEHNIKIDDNQKAQLIGQLSVATAIEDLLIYGEIKARNLANHFVQELISSGVALNLGGNVGKQISEAISKK